MKLTIDLKYNEIYLEPAPTASKAKGIVVYSELFETNVQSGYMMADIVKGQSDYSLPPQLKGKRNFKVIIEI